MSLGRWSRALRRAGVRVSLLALPFAATVGTAARGADVRPEDYAFASPLTLDGQAAVYGFALPDDVYRHSARADLSDLCIVNGHQEVVPFEVRPPVAEVGIAAPTEPLSMFALQSRDREPSRQLKLRLQLATGGVVDIVEPAQAHPPTDTGAYLIDTRGHRGALTALQLQWPEATADFASRMTIEASDDLQQWSTIVNEAPVVNLHFGGSAFTRSEIVLPRVTQPFLRLSWADPVPVVALTSVRGVREAQRVESVRSSASVVGRVGAQPGDYEFELAGRQPIDRVTLLLPEPNTVADVEFQVRDRAADAWRSVAQGRLHRLRINAAPDLVNAPLAMAPTRARYWRVRVAQAGGGLGRGVPTLVGGWLANELRFVARGEPPFRLLYGNAVAAPLAVPTGTLVATPGRDAPVRLARVGAPETLGGPARLQPPPARTDYRRWVLWGVLLLAVAGLALMATKLLKSMG